MQLSSKLIFISSASVLLFSILIVTFYKLFILLFAFLIGACMAFHMNTESLADIEPEEFNPKFKTSLDSSDNPAEYHKYTKKSWLTELKDPGITKQLESNYGYISITQKSDNTSSSSSDNFSEEFSELEQVCNNLIDLIVRDFIQSWYTYCCDDKIFLSDCKNLMKLSLQKIFRRCLEIDWNLFFSTVPFEKLLRHINSIRKQRSNPKNAMKNNSSRKKNFVEYFQLVTSAVLAELIPGKLYNIQILHLMLRELVVNNVVMPSIEYYSDSDTINQYFCYFLSDITQTQDSFTTVLKLYANSKELTSVKLHAEHEFDKLNSNDGVGNDGKVKRQIHAIQDLMCVCDQKLEEIRLGGGSNFHNLGQAGSRASLFKDELIETKELKLKQLFKYLHLQGRTKDVDMMKFNMEAASLKEILFSREDNGREENGSLKMSDFDKKLGNEEKKRLTIIFQFFDSECDSYLGDHFNNLNEYLVSNLPTQNIESISCHEILTVRDGIQNHVDQIWCEYKNAVRITDATIKSITPDDHFEVDVVCDHGEEYWTARVKYEVLENLHEDIKKLALKMTVPFPGKLRGFLAGKIGQIKNLNMWLSDVILGIKFCTNEDSQTAAYALLGQTLKVPKVRPSEKINDGFDGFEGLEKFESLTESLDSSKQKELPLSSVQSKVSKGTRKMSDDGSVDLERLGEAPTSPKNKVQERLHKISQNAQNKSGSSNQSSNDTSPKHEPELMEINGPSKIIIEIVAETFKLCDNKKWIRRQIQNQLHRLGPLIRLNKPIIEVVKSSITSYETIISRIQNIISSYWPHDKVNGGYAKYSYTNVERTEDQILRTSVLAKTRILATIPDQVKLLLGGQDCKDAAVQFLQCFKETEDNTMLLVDVFEAVLEVMFPQVNWAMFRKVL